MTSGTTMFVSEKRISVRNLNASFPGGGGVLDTSLGGGSVARPLKP